VKRFRQDYTTARTSPAMYRSRADGAARNPKSDGTHDRNLRDCNVQDSCRILCCTRHNQTIWKVPQEHLPNASRVFSISSRSSVGAKQGMYKSRKRDARTPY
jgi:hypothetical protein